MKLEKNLNGLVPNLIAILFNFLVKSFEGLQLLGIGVGFLLGRIQLGPQSYFAGDQFLGQIITLALQSQIGLV